MNILRPGPLVLIMTKPARKVLRITVCALAPGRLGLEWDYDDGTRESSFATPAVINKVLDEHGHAITVEALEQIAFHGHRRVLNLPLNRQPNILPLAPGTLSLH
jgi:hypothetical protein